ncbi:biotin/lipoyl-binding protein [Cellulomonas sp. JZ18]|uniref:efflux RND transporter periplasmic adaptor subunit n=1 Tax=Cellulomonas sp. JZ18 TaxID=2654191 RepID=UPI0012D41F69|nr:biotin/lipoyl-binding protein [Cellulomonas sp. JZ18]QGQ18956.1 biotin/lipoyl-binding protein [Cellulomonas sp. JZ18]
MVGVWRRSRPRTRVVAGVVALAAVGALVWWLWWRGGTDASAQEAPATRTVAASLSTLEKTVTTTGTLTPAVHEDVSFTVAGTVTAVGVAAGDTVTAGQTLATVDTLRLDAAVLQARATLAAAQADLDAAQDADDGTDAAQAAVDAAAAQVAVAQADVDAAVADVSAATLVSPVAGVVTSVGVAVGDSVGSGSGSGTGSASSSTAAPGGTSGTSTTSTAAFTVVGTDGWQVDATVGEADVAHVDVGDQVEITSDDLDGTVFGTVAEVGLVSTSTSGTAAYPVTVAVTGAPAGLHDGVQVDVAIVYERRTDVLTVPSAAVATADDGTTTVTRVAADGTQEDVTVEVGEASGDVVEVVSGLAEGDEVVVTVFTGRAGQTGGGTDGGQGQAPGAPPEGWTPPDGGAGFPGGRTGGGDD